MKRLRFLFAGLTTLFLCLPTAFAGEATELCSESISWEQKVEETWAELYPEYKAISSGTRSVIFKIRDSSGSNLNSPEVVEIELLKQEQANAFASPIENQKAKIFLTSGLIRELSDCGELAFVLAHEMSHIRHDHFAPSISALILPQALIEKMVSTHHQWELTADKEAVVRLESAGLDNKHALSLLGKLAKFEASTQPKWLRWHPEFKTRTKNLQAAINRHAIPREKQDILRQRPLLRDEASN